MGDCATCVHEYQKAAERPKGCVCNIEDWGFDASAINPICGEFVRCEDGFCVKCSHDEGCHKTNKGAIYSK